MGFKMNDIKKMDLFCFKDANGNNEVKYTCMIDKTMIIWHKQK